MLVSIIRICWGTQAVSWSSWFQALMHDFRKLATAETAVVLTVEDFILLALASNASSPATDPGVSWRFGVQRCPPLSLRVLRQGDACRGHQPERGSRWGGARAGRVRGVFHVVCGAEHMQLVY